MKFEHTQVFNFEGALRGMRNPKKSWSKSNNRWEGDEYVIGENDYDLAMRLIKAGSDHRKFLRQIKVSVDIESAWYWFKEYATYKVSTVENSTSSMHTILEDDLIEDAFEWDYMTPFRRIVLEHLNELKEEIKILEEKIAEGRKDLIPHREAKWRELIQDIPGSFIYRRTCTLNYEVLRNMYQSRKNHKLREWSEDFVEWVEGLPYCEFITVKGRS